MSQAILGISAYYHDSAAALLIDGEIVAAAQEERFTRIKHDPSFPANAVAYVLHEAGLDPASVATVAFYDKPFLKFERLLETYHAFAPRGFRSFLTAMPVWIKEKLFLRSVLQKELAKVGLSPRQLLFPEHHLSHAASAFFPSPFAEAAVLTLDGVGEWATTSIGHGKGNQLEICSELHFPHSLGLLYSAFTHYCGFKVNSGEYKLMGLAPYGNAGSQRVEKWKALVLDRMLDLRADGSFLLNLEYFDYPVGLTMCRDEAWEGLFGVARRQTEQEPLTQEYMDLAYVVQAVTEEVVVRLAASAQRRTGCDRLCLAGGVALNCVANGKLLETGLFREIWIQPASGDAGGALGAAYAAYHIGEGGERSCGSGEDRIYGSYLGPEYAQLEAKRSLRKYRPQFTEYADFGALTGEVAELLEQGNVVGWFQGRAEFGPRALGNRSILGDPRNPEMQKRMNLKIKYREGFRPFAPSVLEEDIQEYFDLPTPSPYMLIVAPVQQARRNELPPDYSGSDLYTRLYYLRSDIPAVTHVDFSARVQSVSKRTNERYWRLIDAFKQRTGCGVLVNTSFNVRGEPMVLTPEDAYRCFMRTEMDYLVIDHLLFDKKRQNGCGVDWNKEEFAPD